MDVASEASSYVTGVQRSDGAALSSVAAAVEATLSVATESVAATVSSAAGSSLVSAGSAFSSTGAAAALTLAVPLKENVSRDGGTQFSSLQAP